MIKKYKYFTGEVIQFGDVVEEKGFLFIKPKRGHVSYIPGISKPHPEMENEIGISYINGQFTGFFVDPENKVLRKSIRLVERSNSKDFITPDMIAPEDW